MRNTWKPALAVALALGLGAAVAQAQPFIAGNTSAFGGGPIYTSDFTSGLTPHAFVPTGATAGPADNGRGLAIGGKEVFYTELTGSNGFGPTDIIRVAPYNSGDGGADTRSLLNPRPGSGIQDLTFSNGNLYVLTGYDTQAPWVYELNFINGDVLKGPIVIAQPSGTNFGVDGFAIHPTTGNFLMNHGDALCIYSQYDSTTGALVPGTTFTVPGGPGQCTGVDTDGTSFYFLTDFNSITRTDLDGNMTGFSYFSGGDELFIEDLSLVHPVTIITDVGDGHLWLGLRNSDDIGTNFDIKVDLLKNGVQVPGATALTRCVNGLTRNPTFADDVIASFPSIPDEPLVSGDVLSFMITSRIGTNPDDTKCIGGSHRSGLGIFIYYDSVGRASNIPITIQPNLEEKFYLHSDGGPCPLGNSNGSPSVTSRFLDDITPLSDIVKCKESGGMDFDDPTPGANPYTFIGTWSLAPLP